ncbi:hypothetical protein CHCC14809_2906 [Bacillus licheniformis]|nr:hypothetical protein B4090_3000 [Bacillus licheniformis]TWN15920.1 hypothetical protein CHCC14564_0485 [Bacillus licheniformis LMG 17339]TWJ88400.1 hypothetical protein CHCC20495_3357 [Bacillus licheniformis]TWJ92800.1 hypothetical protein CHCC20493_4031 [Bacillus licheniformis]TWK07897.1 hypothetical protein CHCC20487_0308 [Bacillus licheniformis]
MKQKYIFLYTELIIHYLQFVSFYFVIKQELFRYCSVSF